MRCAMGRTEFVELVEVLLLKIKDHPRFELHETENQYLIEDSRIHELLEFKYSTAEIRKALSFLDHIKALRRMRMGNDASFNSYMTTDRGKQLISGDKLTE